MVPAGKPRRLPGDINTTFLFKAITGRWRKTPGRDIDDLRLIISKNLQDWSTIRSMWNGFKGLPEDVVDKAREAVQILRDQGMYVEWEP